MTVSNDQLAAVLRQMESGFKAELETLRRQVNAVQNEQFDLESLAGKRSPYRLQVNIDVPIGTTSILTGTRTLTRSGPFVAKRLYASLHIKTMKTGGDAAWVGRYLPISSHATYTSMDAWKAGVSVERCVNPPLDFVWGYSDGVSDRERQNQYISGDVLARADEDGFLAISEVFASGANVTFQVQPLRAVGNEAPWNEDDGVETFTFSAIFEGYRILQPLVA